jgi:hypothetical protein
MVAEFVDAVKLIGALAGLASSAFLVYDRLFRERPILFLFPGDFKVNIRIKNISEETIIIDEIVIKPPGLTVARANDLITKNEEVQLSFYPSTAGKDDPRFQGNFIVLKPTDVRTFALHRFAEFENADDKTRVTIRCRWQNTRKLWPIPRYVRIKTTVKQVRGLQDAAYAGKA